MSAGRAAAPMSARPFASLFSPASVAVVGASDDPRKWGNWLARGALRGESRRAAYLVNHRGGEILGRRSFRSLDELPEAPELVVLAVPVAALSDAVDQALLAGTRAIVAISAGENDSEAARRLDASLAARVREAGALLVGPNCLGVLDSAEQLELVTNPLPAGSIGLISQSGNLALELGMLAAEQGLGFSRFVSLGNQADVDAGELVGELTAHPATRLIALYVEDFRDGREFARAAARAVTSGKPVVALAIERGQATTRAVRSHTGALASDGAAIDAAFHAAGIERVRTPRELIDICQGLLSVAPLPGRRLAVLCDGGGHGAIAAAAAGAAGLALPVLSDRTATSLREVLPASASVANPIDLAGAAERDVRAFESAARVLLGSGEVDALLVTGFFGGYAEYGEKLADAELLAARRLGEAAAGSGRPIVVHTMFASGAAATVLREVGVPTYAAIESAVGVLRRLAARGEAPAQHVPPMPVPAVPATDAHQPARRLLSEAGIPFVAARSVTGLQQAIVAAEQLGYPVVLKALGRLHKSDAGGVVLGLGDQAQLARAFAEVSDRLAPSSFSIERMAPLGDGLELLIGARWDARFGPVAVAGSGGIYAEILDDSAVALAPVSEAEARRMLASLRAAPMLAGARGRPALDLDAAARALAALSVVAACHPELAEIEINPLLVTPDGALALDARLILAR